MIKNLDRDKKADAHYEILCLTCGESYDAAISPWCECVTDNPTFLCPHCGHCFCNAPADARKTFWASAPPGLWHRRLRNFEFEVGGPPSELGNPLRRPLVLVADDEPDTRRLAYRAIESMGYGVLLAKDGEMAFALAKIYRPDLILTDQMMPHGDGRHLCRKVKEDPNTRGIRVIVMSGLYKKDSQRIETLRDFEADDYINKPIAFDRLAEVLASWLAPVAAV